MSSADFKTVSYKKNYRNRNDNENSDRKNNPTNSTRYSDRYGQRTYASEDRQADRQSAGFGQRSRGGGQTSHDRRSTGNWRSQPPRADKHVSYNAQIYGHQAGPLATDPAVIDAFDYSAMQCPQNREVHRDLRVDMQSRNPKVLTTLEAINDAYRKKHSHRDTVQAFYDLAIANISKAIAISQRTSSENIDDCLAALVPLGMETERRNGIYARRPDKSAACADYNLQSILNGVLSVIPLMSSKKPVSRVVYDQKFTVGETANMANDRKENIELFKNIAEETWKTANSNDAAFNATDSWADASEIVAHVTESDAILDRHVVSIVVCLRSFASDPLVNPFLSDLSELFNAKISLYNGLETHVEEAPLVDPCTLDRAIAKRAHKGNIQAMELVVRGSAYVLQIMENYEALWLEKFGATTEHLNETATAAPVEIPNATPIATPSITPTITPPNSPEPVTPAKPKISLAPQGALVQQTAAAVPRKKKFDLSMLNMPAVESVPMAPVSLAAILQDN